MISSFLSCGGNPADRLFDEGDLLRDSCRIYGITEQALTVGDKVVALLVNAGILVFTFIQNLADY